MKQSSKFSNIGLIIAIITVVFILSLLCAGFYQKRYKFIRHSQANAFENSDTSTVTTAAVANSNVIVNVSSDQIGLSLSDIEKENFSL